MNKKLYVGNLSYSLTNEELGSHFGQAGEVASVKIIMDQATGRSKGFAFVEMADENGVFFGDTLFVSIIVGDVTTPAVTNTP